VHRLTVQDSSGKILAGTIFSARCGFGIASARKPWATPYCGPAFASGLSCRHRQEISGALATHLATHYDYVGLDTGPDFTDLLGFRRSRWSVSLRSTYRFLRDGSTVASQVEPSVRRHLRKVESRGLSIVQSSDPGPLFEMYKSLYQRQGIALRFGAVDFGYFCERLRPLGPQLWYVYERQDPVAGMLIIKSKGRHYYCLSAFRRDLAASAGPTVLLLHYIDQNLKPGEEFDFIGANPETPGITRFKSKFNPCERFYARLEHKSWRYQVCKPLVPFVKFCCKIIPLAGGDDRLPAWAAQ
jgi:hypothetical protein